MKKIFLTLLIAFTTITCKAQNNIVDYNKVYVNNISIATFKPSDFISTIGNPSSISIYDMGFNVDVYKKNETRFTFYKNDPFGGEEHSYDDDYNKGDLISFNIVDYSIFVKVNNTTFEVDGNIEILKTVFKNSYYEGKEDNLIFVRLRGDMSGGNWISDSVLRIKYDSDSQKIIEIYLHYPL